ncbi:threonine ammonia-lyase [Jeotgalibacillus marinus]|uniref:Threonine/serine dehydratase n=1 Tax=Jeotgalibacillus marinus TaxID=86667 RepID=A0ABV3Q2U5_9BACL
MNKNKKVRIRLREDDQLGNSYDTASLFKAAERLSGIVHRTPCKTSSTLNERADKNVLLKLENLQRTGSFKIRGAYNKIAQLTDLECKKGIIAASAGNHAQGVALAGMERGVHATVFMPECTPSTKVAATRDYGAVVELVGQTFDETFEAACEQQSQTGKTFIHPFDDLTVIEGQATVALEMMQQCPLLDTIVVPAGGGGLLAGTALGVKSIRPDIRVIGVQASAASAIASAFFGHDLKLVPFMPTMAEGIKVKKPGELTLSIIRSYVDDMVTVSEAEIANALLFMLEREKMLVEGAGAAGVAAILNKRIGTSSKHAGVIVSGGNFDVAKLEMCRKVVEEDKQKRARAKILVQKRAR